jgi:hypothetical protein
MAVEFNIAATHKFFLGEDKVIDLTIFGQDGVTPLDVLGLPLEWNLKKTDRANDPGILTKGITALAVSTGITIVGVFNVVPITNTQKVRITFQSADTDPDVTSVLATPYTLKAAVAYRHSLKRKDVGNEGILTHGSFTFVQATER